MRKKVSHYEVTNLLTKEIRTFLTPNGAFFFMDRLEATVGAANVKMEVIFEFA